MLGYVFAKPLQADILENGKDNTAPNTYKKYAAAADWCVKNDAAMLDCAPSTEHPSGCYKVVASQEFLADYFSKMPEAERAALQLSFAKSERAQAVASITVTVDDMVFDGDEKAQERMARTVTAAIATGASMDATTTWVLHNNSVAQVTVRQLATALRKAGKAQTALWTVPYQN